MDGDEIMPSSPKIQKERIVQAVLDILLEKGYAAVNIKALECSTQLISWQFGGMDGSSTWPWTSRICSAFSIWGVGAAGQRCIVFKRWN